MHKYGVLREISMYFILLQSILPTLPPLNIVFYNNNEEIGFLVSLSICWSYWPPAQVETIELPWLHIHSI